MELKINQILFIIITTFTFLKRIFSFNHDELTFNKFVGENFMQCRILDKRNYRLLAKCKKDKDSNNIYLNEFFPDNNKKKSKYITNNKKWNKEKNTKSNKPLLNKAQYYTEVIDYNNGIFDGKHFHFEKKLIRKKDYDAFLEKKRRIRDISLKKIKFKNYGFGTTIFLLFFFLGIGLPILQGLELLKKAGDEIKKLGNMSVVWDAIEKCLGTAKEYFFLIAFSTIILILVVILVIVIPKILRNNEKYNRIKAMYE
ncbi:fam-m protein [Plasmodium malariae]|uniref:Fam-m protein n=1 Tax=Plasmodium malariae TaxID=5858 RepID=A0A1D3SM15_PLAMA|nr:fam-m protein [Plasmodium malariae]SCO92861.1 fam-m protein [Plasmodium malariae]